MDSFPVHESGRVTSFGCGCKKNSLTANASTTTTHRVTVYQALDPSGNVVGEYSSLSEARAKASEVGGRVKVTSQSASA